ncbi:MAG: hypothetical protein R6W83_07405, partial [Cryobacterium sp.]
MVNVQKRPVRPPAVGSRRRGGIAAASGLALGGAAGLGIVLVTVATAVMARTIVTPPRPRIDDTRIVHVHPRAGTVTLQATPDSILPGEYSFFFGHGAGHAHLGEIVQHAAGVVTRRFLAVDGADLAMSTTGRFSGWVYRTPADLGGLTADVLVSTPAGDAPAWLFPAGSHADAGGAGPGGVPGVPGARCHYRMMLRPGSSYPT